MSVLLTNKEAAIIFSAAGNMRDDFLDYYGSMYGEEKAIKLQNIFLSGMDKLKVAAIKIEQPKKKLPHPSLGEYPESQVDHSEY